MKLGASRTQKTVVNSFFLIANRLLLIILSLSYKSKHKSVYLLFSLRNVKLYVVKINFLSKNILFNILFDIVDKNENMRIAK